ncbi:hypothetical protein BGZ95_007625, partial [Linnemannia exigua]
NHSSTYKNCSKNIHRKNPHQSHHKNHHTSSNMSDLQAHKYSVLVASSTYNARVLATFPTVEGKANFVQHLNDNYKVRVNGDWNVLSQDEENHWSSAVLNPAKQQGAVVFDLPVN